MIWFILIFFCIAGFLIGGCTRKTKPEPEPEPDPDKPKWEDYYPVGWYMPVFDIYKRKWQERDFTLPNWNEYEITLKRLMEAENRKDQYNDLTLAKILTAKEGDRYLFRWTNDLDIWEQEDYWDLPYEVLTKKDTQGNIDPNGIYRCDCDGFAAFHCDYLNRFTDYFAVWWLEVYWNRFSGGGWWGQGHAITIYKRTSGSNWRCFSNQQLLGMSNGYETIEEIIRKFCPDDDNHKLIRVNARHPITGELLWEMK